MAYTNAPWIGLTDTQFITGYRTLEAIRRPQRILLIQHVYSTRTGCIEPDLAGSDTWSLTPPIATRCSAECDTDVSLWFPTLTDSTPLKLWDAIQLLRTVPCRSGHVSVLWSGSADRNREPMWASMSRQRNNKHTHCLNNFRTVTWLSASVLLSSQDDYPWSLCYNTGIHRMHPMHQRYLLRPPWNEPAVGPSCTRIFVKFKPDLKCMRI